MPTVIATGYFHVWRLVTPPDVIALWCLLPLFHIVGHSDTLGLLAPGYCLPSTGIPAVSLTSEYDNNFALETKQWV